MAQAGSRVLGMSWIRVSERVSEIRADRPAVAFHVFQL